jgi:ABC-2 type transport system ATP-binding protein
MADLRHLKDADDRVDEVLSTVRMLDRADGYISNLSKGMRQRVGIAQALLHQPEVLILDEPTIGLDPAQIVEVRNLIRSIGKQRTILLSTHILSEAQQLCDRVLIINRGKIVVEDTPEDLQSRLIGSQRSYLKIKGDGDGLDKLVSAVPGITNVIEKSDGVLEFDSMPGTDIRPDVVRSVVNAGYDLLEIRPIGISLEEIFMQLTRDEPGRPQTRDEDFVDNPEIYE